MLDVPPWKVHQHVQRSGLMWPSGFWSTPHNIIATVSWLDISLSWPVDRFQYELIDIFGDKNPLRTIITLSYRAGFCFEFCHLEPGTQDLTPGYLDYIAYWAVKSLSDGDVSTVFIVARSQSADPRLKSRPFNGHFIVDRQLRWNH